mmetsp:Transcript_46096/g.148532  ORF Transcript_46096/g.148532 Transcript_46096/m.148532 type:complete len:217 (+) Transcript_46096:2698-3348(+)
MLRGDCARSEEEREQLVPPVQRHRVQRLVRRHRHGLERPRGGQPREVQGGHEAEQQIGRRRARGHLKERLLLGGVLPQQRVRLCVVRQAQRQQRGNRDALGSEGVDDGVVQPAVALVGEEDQCARRLGEGSDGGAAVHARAQQVLDDPMRQPNHGHVVRVQERAAEPERRVGAQGARHAVAGRGRGAAAAAARGGAVVSDLGVDGVHDWLARGERV